MVLKHQKNQFTWFIITHGSHIFEKEKSNYYPLYDIQFFEVVEITEIDGSLILKDRLKVQTDGY
jgi:hypothetical protein